MLAGVFAEDNLLPAGLHRQEIVTADRYGRRFPNTLLFEVVEALPQMIWQGELFE